MTALNAAILFNSTSGSDTQSSGSSAGANVYGSGASTTSASAVVTGITTTGVQAGDLLWVQSSSGRQFSVIASVDSGTQVTCDDTFANTESSRTWAIGGKRATLAGSEQLIESDGHYGFTIQLDSGFVETGLPEFDVLNTVGGSPSQGSFTIQGDPNYTVKPILEWNTSGRAFDIRQGHVTLKDFSARNIHSLSGDFMNTGGNGCKFINLSVANSSSPFNSFNSLASLLKGFSVVNCEIGHCRSTGISAFSTNANIVNCWIHDCVSHGISMSGGSREGVIFGNIISANGANGIYDSRSTSTQPGGVKIIGNVFHSNTTNGYQFTDSTVANTGTLIFANVFSQNGGYGINAAGTASENDGYGLHADNNAFFNNTSGSVANVVAGANDITLTADPFVDSAASDFNIADNTAGNTLRANNFSINTDTAVYPFRQYVSDAFGGGGGSQFHPLG